MIFFSSVLYSTVHIYIVKAEGIESVLVFILAASLNFTWSMTAPTIDSFGYLRSAKQMDGIIGDVGKETLFG